MTEAKTDFNDYLALKVMTKSEAVFQIGDKEFTMKPLTPKKLRLLFEVLDELGKSTADLKNLKDTVGFMMDKLIKLFPIIFNQDVKQEFIDDYVSVPLCIEIWESFVKLNMLGNIIPFLQRAEVIKTKVVEIKEK